MATLYTHAESNTRKTWLYLSFFFILIIAIGWFLSYYYQDQLILYIATAFSILTSISSYWYSDKIILAMTRAKPIKKDDNPELYRLVENLCITAGLPLPKIYVLEESQPNAFATGRDTKHAVLAVTRGLLEKLEKTELEGVISHELAHIGNKDILLQAIVVILAGIIVNISNLFLRMSHVGRGRRSNSKGNILALLGIVSIILAPTAATLIKLAISRKREFLADASGALLTRYPEGLARALEKISTDPNPLRVAGDSTAHLFIASPFRGEKATSQFTKLFMTHPSVEERVRALRGMSV